MLCHWQMLGNIQVRLAWTEYSVPFRSLGNTRLVDAMMMEINGYSSGKIFSVFLGTLYLGCCSSTKSIPMQIGPLDQKVRSITCMTVSPSREYIAVGEELVSSNQISIFSSNNLERVKALPHQQPGKIITSCFSNESEVRLR